MSCKDCINQGKDICIICVDNPIYSRCPTTSYHQEYTPACPIGISDCVRDPAYIKHYYPESYKETYGDKTPQEVAKKCYPDLENNWCNDYDDEDK